MNIVMASTAPNFGQKSTALSRISSNLLCATIATTILFSGIPGGNTVNFVVTAVFVGVAVGTSILERRPFRFYAEIVILMIWLCYSLVPSLGADSLNLATERAQQMLQLIILTLVAMNVVAWNGKVEIYLFVFFFAAIVAYFSSIAGFGFGVIDTTMLQEMNSSDRIVGTHSNANQFGTLMVQAQLAALLFVVQTKNAFFKAFAVLAIVVFCIAVLHSGSRTALVGLIIALAGLAWAFRIWRIRYMLRTLLLLVALSVMAVASYIALESNSAVSSRIDSFAGNEQLMGRYENLLRLISNFGDVDNIDNSIEGSASDRARLAVAAWDAAIERPFGLGLNNFRVGFGKYAHSNYFELLATTGFLGLAIYLLIYAFMFRRAIRCRRLDHQSRMVSRIFCIGLFSIFIMDIAHVSYFLKSNWLFLALGVMSLAVLDRPRASRVLSDQSTPEILFSDTQRQRFHVCREK